MYYDTLLSKYSDGYLAGIGASLVDNHASEDEFGEG
jgi:hypothetical protein